MAGDLDPRLHPFRDDLAASSLKGRVEAKRFVDATSYQVCVPVLDVIAKPDATGLATQMLFGEVFDVYEEAGALAWGQCRADGYVGYARKAGLGEPKPATDRIDALSAHVYAAPNFKSLPVMSLSMGSLVEVTGAKGDFLSTPDGYVSQKHVGGGSADFVEVAEQVLGAPYLWGGRSAFGLDCSALVQLALMAVGKTCPRDSDMQMRDLGRVVDGPYERGDLVFWKGHVGIMCDATTLLHANIHHMRVAFEPIADAVARIAKTDGPVLAHKRL